MEKGADVREKKMIHGFVQLAFRGKTVREHVCMCIHKSECLNEGGLKWGLKLYFGTPSSPEQLHI